eukprot:scpid2903/ scgid4292/ Tyrosine-protein kinase receptor TYRO3; Tyrosine-protein kinase SKY
MESRWVTVHSGSLLKCPSKKSRVRKKWRQRWYVLVSCSGGTTVELHHFDSAKQAMRSGSTHGVRSPSAINSDTVEQVAALFSHPKHDNVLCIRLKDEREVYLAAQSSEDMDAWHTVLSDRFKQRKVCLKVQWQYQDDLGDWCNYSEGATSKLEDMHRRGVTLFQLDKQYSGATKTYCIYLDDMIQASPRSGTKRLIQRLTTLIPAKKQSATSQSTHSSAVTYRYGNSLPSGKPCTAAARKSSPIPAVRGGIDTEDRRESNAEGSDSDADDNSEDISVDDSDNDLFTWLYATDTGAWIQYDADNCALLEREYLSQAPVCLLSAGKAARFKLMTARRRNKAGGGRTFVTFGAMQEINPATGMRREVRRVLPGQISALKPPADVTNVSDVLGVATMRNADTPTPDWVSGESDSVKAMLEAVRSRQLPRDSIQLHDTIGRGAFGRVSLATLTTVDYPEGVDVAVKTLQADRRHAMQSPEDQEKKLHEEILKEASTMIRFDHPNIVRLIGICCLKMPIMLVIEYMNGGDLLRFLRKPETHLNLDEQLSIILQVAQAMVYLVSEKQFVHRDLAARNVLVHKERDGTVTAKVTDFGLSRDMYSSEGYRMSMATEKLHEVRLPAKWMAVESLEYFIFNSATDVWSFGVMTWEVMTHGQVPYTGVEAPLMYLELTRGLKLSRPTTCPDAVYKLILACCHHTPKERPGFVRLRDQLTDLLCDVKLAAKASGSPKTSRRNDWEDVAYKSPEVRGQNSGPPPTKPPRLPAKPSQEPSTTPPARPSKPPALTIPQDDGLKSRSTSAIASQGERDDVRMQSPPSSAPPVPARDESKQRLLEWVQKSLHSGPPTPGPAEAEDDTPPGRPTPPQSDPSDEDDDGHSPAAKSSPKRVQALSSDSTGTSTVGKECKREEESSPSESALDRSHGTGEAPRPQPETSSRAESTAGLNKTGESPSMKAQRDIKMAAQMPSASATASRRLKSSQILERMKMFETSDDHDGKPTAVSANKPVIKAKPQNVVLKPGVASTLGGVGSSRHSPQLTRYSPSTMRTANQTKKNETSSANQTARPPITRQTDPISNAPSAAATTTSSESAASTDAPGAKQPSPQRSPGTGVRGSVPAGHRSTLPTGEHIKLAGRRTTLSASAISAETNVSDKPTCNGYMDGHTEREEGNEAPTQTSTGDDTVCPRPFPESRLSSSSEDSDQYMVMKTGGKSESDSHSLPLPRHSYVNVPSSPHPPNSSYARSASLPADEDGYEVMRKTGMTPASDDAEYSTTADIRSLRSTPDIPGTSSPAYAADAIHRSTSSPVVTGVGGGESAAGAIDEEGYELMTKPLGMGTPDALPDCQYEDEGYTLATDIISTRNTPETVSISSVPREASIGKASPELGKMTTLARKSFSLLTGLARIRDVRELDLLKLDTLRALASEEGVTFNHWQTEDLLRGRLAELWHQQHGKEASSRDGSPQADKDDPARPPAPLPDEALSPLDLIVKRSQSASDDAAAATTDGGKPGNNMTKSPSCNLSASAASLASITESSAEPAAAPSPQPPLQGHAEKSPVKQIASKPPSGKPTPPPRPKSIKPSVPPRPSPSKLKGGKDSPSTTAAREKRSCSHSIIRWESEDTALVMPNGMPSQHRASVDYKGYVESANIASVPSRKLTSGSSLESAANTPSEQALSCSTYLTVNGGEEPWERSDTDDVILQLEADLLAKATVGELQAVARCVASDTPAVSPAAQSKDRGQLTALIRFGVRSQDGSGGRVGIAGALMSANRLLLPPVMGGDFFDRVEPMSPIEEDIAQMYEEGYSFASDLVYRGPHRPSAPGSPSSRSGAQGGKRKASSPDSVFNGKSNLVDTDVPRSPGRADFAKSSAHPPVPVPPRPKFGRKLSAPQLPRMAPPETSTSPPTSKTPDRGRKGRLASAYHDVILPAFSPAKGKFATLFKRKQSQEPKDEKETGGRTQRSRSITELSMFSTKNKVNARSSIDTHAAASSASRYVVNKRGSMDDTFLDSMKASGGGAGGDLDLKLGPHSDYYLKPSDEGDLDNHYADVDYAAASALKHQAAVPPPLEAITGEGEEQIDLDNEYMAMSSFNPNTGGPLHENEEEYLDMASFTERPNFLQPGQSGNPGPQSSAPISIRPQTSQASAISSADQARVAANMRSPPKVPPPSLPTSPPSQSAPATTSTIALPRHTSDEVLAVPKLVPETEGDFDAAYSVMPVSQIPTGAAYQVSEPVSPPGEPTPNFQLKNVASPSDIEKLPTSSIKSFLRENSIKYKDTASRAELIEEAKELWADDAYFPIADLVVPKLDNLQSEAAVRALSVQQMQMVLESHGHDGASDSRDERILAEYVVQLWQQLMEPSDPSPDACPDLSTLRPSDIANLDDETAAAIASNYRISLISGEKPQQIKEKVWNLWVKKQAALTGSARTPT